MMYPILRNDNCNVTTKSWRLKDHSRWVFRKNSIEFLVGLTTYLYYFYTWLYTTSPRSHVFSRMFYDHMSFVTWYDYFKFPCYLYLVYVVWLDVCNQVFECMGNLFLLWALITCNFFSSRQIMSSLILLQIYM